MKTSRLWQTTVAAVLGLVYLLIPLSAAQADVTPVVAAGSNHSVMIKSDGTLWAWGDNEEGQLGDDTAINRNIPTQIGTTSD